MYDAFAKIDGALGGGAASGRDGDDLRMEEAEWMAGYSRVTGYGFVGLSPLKLADDASAMQVFKLIDDNGERLNQTLPLNLTLTLNPDPDPDPDPDLNPQP